MLRLGSKLPYLFHCLGRVWLAVILTYFAISVAIEFNLGYDVGVGKCKE
jgi:hypothetical protein